MKEGFPHVRSKELARLKKREQGVYIVYEEFQPYQPFNVPPTDLQQQIDQACDGKDYQSLVEEVQKDIESTQE